jgi:hypothetical protein
MEENKACCSFLPKSFTTVTTLSKILALMMFISLPFLGFYLGMKYQIAITPTSNCPTASVNKLTQEEAINRVRQQKEVKDWLLLFTGLNQTNPTTKGRAVTAYDSTEGDSYIIHVFEDLPDHTATFGWYKVNSLSGIITKVTPNE